MEGDHNVAKGMKLSPPNRVLRAIVQWRCTQPGFPWWIPILFESVDCCQKEDDSRMQCGKPRGPGRGRGFEDDRIPDVLTMTLLTGRIDQSVHTKLAVRLQRMWPLVRSRRPCRGNKGGHKHKDIFVCALQYMPLSLRVPAHVDNGMVPGRLEGYTIGHPALCHGYFHTTL